MTPQVFYYVSQQEQERVIRQERIRFSCEKTLEWTQTPSPGHLRRLDDCLRAHIAMHGPCSGSIADIDHNAIMQGRSCDGLEPLAPLSTHGTFWNTRCHRPLAASEHLRAQGIGPEVYQHDLHLRTLRERDVKLLAGNGMHIHVIGLLLSYIFIHVSCKKNNNKYASIVVCMFHYVVDSAVVVCVDHLFVIFRMCSAVLYV